LPGVLILPVQFMLPQGGNVDAMPAQFALADGSLCTRPVTSAITGPAEVCTDESPVTYSVINSGNTFTWSVVGGTILSGNGTSTINVAWSPIGNGDAGVSVYETSCTRGLTVELPVIIHTVGPASISGPGIVPENTTGIGIFSTGQTGIHISMDCFRRHTGIRRKYQAVLLLTGVLSAWAMCL
jgi:hypothetical protein